MVPFCLLLLVLSRKKNIYFTVFFAAPFLCRQAISQAFKALTGCSLVCICDVFVVMNSEPEVGHCDGLGLEYVALGHLHQWPKNAISLK